MSCFSLNLLGLQVSCVMSTPPAADSHAGPIALSSAIGVGTLLAVFSFDGALESVVDEEPGLAERPPAGWLYPLTRHCNLPATPPQPPW